MKSNFQHIKMSKLCGWFGVSRQAHYQNRLKCLSSSIEEGLLLQQVKEIRKNHPKMGTRKMYEMLHPFMLDHQIKMGRDGLFNLLSSNYLLIRKRKRRIRTTNSYHGLKKYPNLIRGLVPTAINQLWVSDITYWKMSTGQYVYISFITDVYSHKIVGYQVAETMEAIESVKALQMALSALGAESPLSLIHHSDRGIQYCSGAYVKQLISKEIKISMTENGDPLENAVAERINGILKGEYLETYPIATIKQAEERLKAVVDLYNNERPHMSIGNLAPNQVHDSKIKMKTKKLWKNYYRKANTFDNSIQDEKAPVN
jgi:putative transposase